MNENLKEIGLLLKLTRQTKNEDIETISDILKINPEQIKKIENGEVLKRENNYSRLIYRKYMEYLEIDYKKYEEFIKYIYPNNVEETIKIIDLNEKQKKEMIVKKSKLNIKNRINLLIIICFIIIFSIITLVNIKHKILSPKEEVNPTTEIKEKILEPQNIIKPDLIENIKIENNNIEIKLDNLKNVKLKLKTKGSSYMDYSDDLEIKKQKTFTENEEEELIIKDATNITINIGNIGAISSFEVNDEEIIDSLVKLTGQYNIKFSKNK